MNNHRTAALVALVFASLLTDTSAAERKKVSFDAPAAGNKYTQQYGIDVGDAPGHQLRVFELLRTYKEGPEFEGVHLKEAWIRGFTDYTESNGLGTSYVAYVMDSGEKIYAYGHFLAHNAGTGTAYKNMTELTITGGTGRFLAIRGIVRAETLADTAKNFNQNHTEIEYWLEK